VYGRKNIVGYDYGPNYDKKEAIEPFVIPVSFGVQGSFSNETMKTRSLSVFVICLYITH